jgi:antitoxin component of MazEF toxin-antitoxin module
MHQKKLVGVGNGVALFIDKPFQRMLGLEAGTHVNIDTDGEKLLIQPTGTR